MDQRIQALGSLTVVLVNKTYVFCGVIFKKSYGRDCFIYVNVLPFQKIKNLMIFFIFDVVVGYPATCNCRSKAMVLGLFKLC